MRIHRRISDSKLAHFLDRWGTPIGLLLLVATIWASSYTGRVQIHENTLASCVRGQIQRVGDVDQDIDMAAFEGLARIRAMRAGDADIAEGYLELQRRAQRREKVNTSLLIICTEVNKSPQIIELRSLATHPSKAAQTRQKPTPLSPQLVRLLRTASIDPRP